MGLLERGLAKLTLEAYQGDNQVKRIGSLTAMYNPESVNLDYAATYKTTAGVNQHHDVSWFRQVEPPTLSLALILDARGPQGGQPVDQQLSTLRALCFTVDEKGEAPYLRVSWGSMSWHGHGYFSGRLTQLSIAYTLFDRNAKPLRATATLTLKGQTSDEMAKLRAMRAPAKQMLLMQDKTSLPQLLAQSTVVVGSAGYLAAAYANDADNLSGWTPGQMLIAR
ncbi:MULTISPECIES: CIS tube protein [Serratia]|uniref:CIS tube protein n=1 Tax=Serratia TaxID=613 RepID=UPI0007A08A05|nr:MULTISPECIES: hypothetical protein [Serratia]KYQ97001.1 hypothetical protein AWY96_00190 [Serratia plymuthica]CAI1560636.1 Uncharacterised protein [Serratia entomophila]